MALRRRQSSTKPVKDHAADDALTVAAGGLPERIALLEGMCGDMRRTLDVQFKRMAAIQAQLDHLAAKWSGR